MPLRNASDCCCFPCPPQTRDGRQEHSPLGLCGRDSLPSSQSMNGQRLLRKPNPARSPFSRAGDHPPLSESGKMVWGIRVSGGTVPICLPVFLGLHPHRQPFLFGVNTWETWTQSRQLGKVRALVRTKALPPLFSTLSYIDSSNAEPLPLS